MARTKDSLLRKSPRVKILKKVSGKSLSIPNKKKVLVVDSQVPASSQDQNEPDFIFTVPEIPVIIIQSSPF